MTTDLSGYGEIIRLFKRESRLEKGGLANELPRVSGPRSATGAKISKPYLVLCTVAAGPGGPAFDAARSAVFELEDRSATALCVFARAIERFQHNRRIRHVYLRSHEEGGKYPGHAWNFKIEAALQLGSAAFSFVNTKTISAWMRRQDVALPEVPELHRRYDSRVKNLRIAAFETAMFASAQCQRSRAFWDGTDGR